MSRPKPNILLRHTNPTTYKSEEVLEAEAIYAIFYKGKPINIRSMNSLIDYPGPKYKKTVYVNSGHAYNLAEKLNEMFKTEDFAVFRLTSGTMVSEKPKD